MLPSPGVYREITCGAPSGAGIEHVAPGDGVPQGRLLAGADCWHTGGCASSYPIAPGFSRNHLYRHLRHAAWGIAHASHWLAVSGFSHVLNRIEAQIRLSMNYDQGRDMASHQQLPKATGAKVYFADHHSPWQRGINENSNDLLRQYLPKGTDLSTFTQEE